MDLINEIMRQQIVPEGPAACDQNIFAPLTFEFGDLLVRVCTPDYADIRPTASQRIGDDVVGDAAHDRERDRLRGEAGPIGLGVSLSLRADDAQELHDQLKEHGVLITVGPFDTPFGRTFIFRDPDGYQISTHGAVGRPR